MIIHRKVTIPMYCPTHTKNDPRLHSSPFRQFFVCFYCVALFFNTQISEKTISTNKSAHTSFFIYGFLKYLYFSRETKIPEFKSNILTMLIHDVINIIFFFYSFLFYYTNAHTRCIVATLLTYLMIYCN